MEDHDPASDPWPPWLHWYPGEPATADDVDVILGDYYTYDPLELVWQGKGGDMGQPTVSCLRSTSPARGPSDDVMAAWLYPIVSGEEHAGKRDDVAESTAPKAAASEPTMMATDSRGKLPTTTTNVMHAVKETNTRRSGFSERRKQARATSGGSASIRTRPSHSGTHSITEKRRRCRITERLRTLQQLVPGCDKCNQASTLEQTIQYMKSLQQQVQAMGTSPAAAALNPAVLQPAPLAAVGHRGSTVAAGVEGGLHVRPAAGTMVVPPFSSVLSYPNYYHQAAVTMPSAPPALYRQAAASAAPSAAAAAGDHHDGGSVAWGSAERRKSRDGTAEVSSLKESIGSPPKTRMDLHPLPSD